MCFLHPQDNVDNNQRSRSSMFVFDSCFATYHEARVLEPAVWRIFPFSGRSHWSHAADGFSTDPAGIFEAGYDYEAKHQRPGRPSLTFEVDFGWTRKNESCFDPDNLSYFSPNQAGYIAKWISGATIPGEDFLFASSELQDMPGADPFEPKHDTASEYSMDSAYQSQTGASRRGNAMPEGYSSLNTQETRSRVNSQFLYSPTLSSDNFSTFPEQHNDLGSMHLPAAAGEIDSGDNTFAYANYSAGQDYSQYSTTGVPRFTPVSGIESGFQWGISEAQNFSTQFNFNATAYSKHPQSIDGSLFSSQDPAELMFSNPTPTQRQLSRPQVDTNVRPSAVRHSSSYTSHQQSLQRQSGNESSYGQFVMSPTSAVSVQLPGSAADFEQQHLLDSRVDKEETASTSLAPQSINDEDELLSASDALEAKTMEEEQGKIARSHPLYQAQPDDNGKYHCPQEGKAGCTHKPTPLKCNYDKYVDSHLKPFRCNKKACVGVQFSSTACLLRHEREAHGMHGHGSRPHLCHFTDCERSVPGNGFPRRYNLFDHMKRVHDYTGPTTEPSPPRAEPAASRKSTGRKRKSTADDALERRHKVAKPTPQQQLQQKREQLQQTFLSKKQELINILAILNGPVDLNEDNQLHKEIDQLIDISSEFKKSLG